MLIHNSNNDNNKNIYLQPAIYFALVNDKIVVAIQKIQEVK